MQYKIPLLTLLVIFILSFISTLLLFYNLDPESNKNLAITIMAISFALMTSSFLTILFFVSKKIYYRWNVTLYNIYSSLRQSIILVWILMVWIFFNKINVLTMEVLWILIIVWLFFEIIFQTIEEI